MCNVNWIDVWAGQSNYEINNSLLFLDMYSLLQLKTKFSSLDGDEVSLPEITSDGETILNALMVKNLSSWFHLRILKFGTFTTMMEVKPWCIFVTDLAFWRFILFTSKKFLGDAKSPGSHFLRGGSYMIYSMSYWSMMKRSHAAMPVEQSSSLSLNATFDSKVVD